MRCSNGDHMAFLRTSIAGSDINAVLPTVKRAVHDSAYKSPRARVSASKFHRFLANYLDFRVNSAFIYCIRLVIVRELGGSLVNHAGVEYYSGIQSRITI